MKQSPIPGFPGYEITDDGRVWSVKTGAFLKSFVNKHGYRLVALYHGGKRHIRKVHRLVLEAFVGPCPEGVECCHNNGDPSDNRLENLRWDTHAANHAESSRGSGLRGADILCIRYLRTLGANVADLASDFDVSTTTIYRIIARESEEIGCH